MPCCAHLTGQGGAWDLIDGEPYHECADGFKQAPIWGQVKTSGVVVATKLCRSSHVWRAIRGKFTNRGGAIVKYFFPCKTLDELQQAYRNLLIEFHPDSTGRDGRSKIYTLKTQQINAEYAVMGSILPPARQKPKPKPTASPNLPRSITKTGRGVDEEIRQTIEKILLPCPTSKSKLPYSGYGLPARPNPSKTSQSRRLERASKNKMGLSRASPPPHEADTVSTTFASVTAERGSNQTLAAAGGRTIDATVLTTTVTAFRQQSQRAANLAIATMQQTDDDLIATGYTATAGTYETLRPRHS